MRDKEPFEITERISWRETNFVFMSYKALVTGLKEAISLQKMVKNREYRIIIQEVV